MRGNGLSAKINDPDPHLEGTKVRQAQALDGSDEAKKTADVLNKFMQKSYDILKNLDVNKQRVRDGQKPANFVLLRGAGLMCHVPTFQQTYGLKAACVAGAGLYKGVASYLGMDVIEVEGATGKGDTNIVNKFKAAKKALDDGFDFVFVHVKWADSLGEDGKWKEKKEFIERIDSAAVELLNLKDTVVAVTADHSTPCMLKHHSADPVPLLVNGPGVRVDDVKEYGERACAKGVMGRIKGIELIPELVNIIGKSPLYGA